MTSHLVSRVLYLEEHHNNNSQQHTNPAENWATQGRVRARHEMLNGQLKTWGVLSQVFHHHITMHGDVFRVCAVITQLTIENGEPLFEVEYTD